MSGRVDGTHFRRWQEEVARDPGSPAFLPLAEVYRREGRLDVARRLCVRGLERRPEHVEAHALLGRLYREQGQLDKAFDEWDIALSLDPQHQGARRAIGYLCLERREWSGAVRHLEAALAQEPGDARLGSALALAKRHLADPGHLPPADPVAELAAPLDRFVRAARVRLALLLEADGRVLTHQGVSREFDLASLASLGAGIHGASRALASLLGEPHFQQTFQGSGDHQLLLGAMGAPGRELVLVAVFGATSNVGLVRVRFQALAREVEAVAGWDSALAGRQDAAAFEAELAAGLHAAENVPLPKLLSS